jgi:hypothetical protein
VFRVFAPGGHISFAKCCLVVCVWASIAAPAFAQQAVRPIANVAPALTPERLRVTGGGSVSASLTIGVPQILPPDAKRRWAVVRRIVIEGNFAELQKQTVALVALRGGG